MSCDSRRAAFFAYLAQDPMVVQALGGSEDATKANLEKIFEQTRDEARARPTTAARQAVCEARTRALFQMFQNVNIKPPTHSKTGLPPKHDQVAYAVLHQTFEAITRGVALPELAQAVLDGKPLFEARQPKPLAESMPAAIERYIEFLRKLDPKEFQQTTQEWLKVANATEAAEAMLYPGADPDLHDEQLHIFARATAVLSFVPGGVTLFGREWMSAGDGEDDEERTP